MKASVPASHYPQAVACVPAWNAEDFIDRTLDALARQTYPNLRVLISVDQCHDRTAERCEARAAVDSRFEVIRQPRRLGWVGNVNALLRRVEAPYVFFAFHDDLLDPPYVSVLVDALESRPDAILAFTDMETHREDGRIIASMYDELEGLTDPAERARRVIQKRGTWWAPHRGVFRTSIGQEIGGLRRHLAGEFSADWPWLVHLALRGAFVRVPGLLCHKIYRPASLSRTWDFSSRQGLAVTLSCLWEVARARVPLPVRVAVAPLLLRQAFDWMARMARHARDRAVLRLRRAPAPR